MSSNEELYARKIHELAPGDLPIERIRFGSGLSSRAFEGHKFFDNNGVGKSFPPDNETTENALTFAIQVGSHTPKRPETSQNIWQRAVLLNNPKVWQPEIQKALKRNLKEKGRKAMAHDIDDFVPLPEGSLVGVTINVTGDLSSLTDNFKQFDPEMKRPDPEQPDGYHDEMDRFVITEQTLRKRRGLMLAANWGPFLPASRSLSYPLNVEQSFGDLGAMEPSWREIHYHFETFELNDATRSTLVIPGREIKDSNHRFSLMIRNAVTSIPKVLTLTVFEGEEELLLKETELVQGYELSRFQDHEHKETGRCAVCGKVGRATDGFAFETTEHRLNRLSLNKGSIKKLFEQRIVFVTTTYDQNLEDRGRAVESCKTCFPAVCHGMHFLTGEIPVARCHRCNRTWRFKHVCSGPKGQIHPDWLASLPSDYERKIAIREYSAEKPFDDLLGQKSTNK